MRVCGPRGLMKVSDRSQRVPRLEAEISEEALPGEGKGRVAQMGQRQEWLGLRSTDGRARAKNV